MEDKLQELSHIQQTASVAAYLERFEELLNEVSDQLEATLIRFFIGGLKWELKNELNIIKPTTLRRAFTLAKVYEAQRDRNRFTENMENTEPIIKIPMSRSARKGQPRGCDLTVTNPTFQLTNARVAFFEWMSINSAWSN